MGSFTDRYAGRSQYRPVKPDYSNQLDLFGSLGADSAHEPPVANDPPALAPALPAHAGGNGSTGPASIAHADGGADDGPAGGPPALGHVVSGSVGDGDEGVGFSPERGPPVEDDEPAAPSRDFRITPSHGIGKGSLHEKARNNLAAIRTLKRIEQENRDATDDEKPVLAKYAGWGAMPNA